jgi:hypothetical protein
MSQRPGGSVRRPQCVAAPRAWPRVVLRDIEGDEFSALPWCDGRFLELYVVPSRGHHPPFHMYLVTNPEVKRLLVDLAQGCAPYNDPVTSLVCS